MSIEELKVAQEGATSWREFIEKLGAECDAALLVVESHVRTQTGLLLSANRNSLHHKAYPTFATINLHFDRPLLELQVAHLRDEQVEVCNLYCNFTRQVNGLLQMYAYEFRHQMDVMMTFETRAEASKPWIPLRISRKSREWAYIWWRGSDDNDKLARAIVDAFANQEVKSDFILAGRVTLPEASRPWHSGCALVGACLAISAMILLLVVI